jgi:hypothetical protein
MTAVLLPEGAPPLAPAAARSLWALLVDLERMTPMRDAGSGEAEPNAIPFIATPPQRGRYG